MSRSLKNNYIRLQEKLQKKVDIKDSNEGMFIEYLKEKYFHNLVKAIEITFLYISYQVFFQLDY